MDSWFLLRESSRNDARSERSQPSTFVCAVDVDDDVDDDVDGDDDVVKANATNVAKNGRYKRW